MRVDGRPMRTLWPAAGRDALQVIDQRQLPHRLVVETLRDADAVARAIREMWVRGAPLIGASAAYDFYSWPNIVRASLRHDSAKHVLKHFAYTAGWKKFEPVWNLLIKTRHLNDMLPVAGGHPGQGRHR